MRRRRVAESCSISTLAFVKRQRNGCANVRELISLPFQRRRSLSAITIDAPALGSRILLHSQIDRPASGSRILPILNASGLGPQFGPSSTGRATPESHKNGTTQSVSFSKLYFRFRVLQLRLHRFKTIHLEVVVSEVGYLNILQDRVCALFILQAKAVRIVVVQFRVF
jgi:hypothetical protein